MSKIGFIYYKIEFFSYCYRKNAKKHSVALIFSVSCSFVDKFPSFGQFFPVILITKNEPREPLPASAFGLGWQNRSLGSFFVIAITGEKLSSNFEIFLLSWKQNNQCNKILLILVCSFFLLIDIYVYSYFFILLDFDWFDIFGRIGSLMKTLASCMVTDKIILKA